MVRKRACSAGSSRKTPVNWVVTVDGALLLHAAHGHAHVLGLDDHGDAARLQGLVDGADDLGRHGLLRLQAAGEDVDHAGELGQADHAFGRVVADVALPTKGTMWCSQWEWNGMSRTTTMSS